MLTRPLTPIEQLFRTVPEFVRMSVKLANPGDTPRVLANLKSAGLGLSLRRIGDTLIAHSEPPTVTRIPESIHDVAEAADYLTSHALPAPSAALAAVGANRNIIAYASDHICCDGGFLRYLYERIGSPDFAPPNLPLLPTAFDTLWRRELEAAAKSPFTDPTTLTRLYPRSFKAPESPKNRYTLWSTPISSLRCYDRSKGRAIGLTEDLWTALSLAIAAYNSALILPFGIMTPVDARPYNSPGEVDWSVCNNTFGVDIFAEGISWKSTLGEVGAAFRRDFREKQKRKFFGPVKENSLRVGTLLSCLSHMGEMVVKPPFSDVWIQNGEAGPWAGQSLTLLTWSKVGCGWNHFQGSLRWPPHSLTDQEADGLVNSIRLALEMLPRDTPVDAAVKEMQKVQCRSA